VPTKSLIMSAETGNGQYNNRVLIVDDNPSIHEDFKKILPAADETDFDLDKLLQEVFTGHVTPDPAPAHDGQRVYYTLAHAFQGKEAYEMVVAAETGGQPYAVSFMDIRMPPGWDGIETIKRIWADHPHVEMVICTAFSDYSWDEILVKIGTSDQLQFLRKPFDVVSIKQMALALTKKWNLARKARQYVQDLEQAVTDRTKELAQKIKELEDAMTEIRQLQEILPMCAYCHKIRDDEGFWHRVDRYLQTHTLSSVSHGVCPDCFENVMAPLGNDADSDSDTSD